LTAVLQAEVATSLFNMS